SDALALQVGNAANAGICGNENALPIGNPRSRDINDIGVRSLCEDRRRIADGTQIDAADAHRFQQRRPRRELDPLDADLPLRKPLFEHCLLPRDPQTPGFLVTNPDFLDSRLRFRARRQRSNGASSRQAEKLPTLHSRSPNDHARDVARSCDVRMMGSPAQTVEHLWKITTRVLPFDDDATHLFLDGRLRRFFFPQHVRSEPYPTLTAP